MTSEPTSNDPELTAILKDQTPPPESASFWDGVRSGLENDADAPTETFRVVPIDPEDSAIDLDLGTVSQIDTAPSKTRWLVSAAAAIALVAGAAFGITKLSGDSDVRAATADETSPTIPTSTTAAPGNSSAADGVGVPTTAVFANDPFSSEPSAQSSQLFVNDSEFIAVDDLGFVRIKNGIVERSPDAVDWIAVGTLDLPPTAGVTGFEIVDGRAAALVGDADGNGPVYSIASSEDLESWDIVPLDLGEQDDGETPFYWTSGLGFNGSTVLLRFIADEPMGDPISTLLDAGILSEADLPRICEVDEGPDEFIVYACDSTSLGDPGDASSTVPTTTAPPMERTVLVRIAVGDPLFDELMTSLDPGLSNTITVVGPFGGPYEQLAEPSTDNGQVFSAGGYFFETRFTEESLFGQTYRSSDGVTWTEVTLDAPGFYPASFVGESDVIVATGYGSIPDGTSALISTNGGLTFTQLPAPSLAYETYTTAMVDDGQLVFFTARRTEPYDGPYSDIPIELEVDGYVMQTTLGGSEVTLLAPDGGVLYETTMLDIFSNPDTMARFDGPNDVLLIWLDPETGEDLVTFDEADFNAASELAAPQPVDGEAGVVPDSGEAITALHVSNDFGTTWTEVPLPDSVSAGSQGSVHLIGVWNGKALIQSSDIKYGSSGNAVTHDEQYIMVDLPE